MSGFSYCSHIAPAGFWKQYKKKIIIKEISVQGPNGGNRVIFWQTQEIKCLNPNEIIEFAMNNGWELVDSIEVQENILKTWYFNNKPIFPLSHEGFILHPDINESKYQDFPRIIKDNLMVYRFKTGSLIIESGTDETNDVNGFIILNYSKNEMALYHLWGE